MAELSLQNVEKIYPNGVKAVTDFNLEIADKEFIIFVGPSGCGKSTTLRMIAGLEEISRGEVYIDGKLINDILPQERDIAMVFQNYSLYPHMTVYENMSFGMKIRKTPKDEIDKRVRNAASILGLTELLARKPKALSGGQRQRAAIGRAIVRNPKVFLMDEPLSNLDAQLRMQMRMEISKLHRDLQTTFIFVTHDQTEAMTLGTRIVVMKDGLIQQIDSPTNLYDHPVNMFVAGFIGSPQMNFIKGGVVIKEGKSMIAIGGYTQELGAHKAEALKEYIGKEITLGIRPEDISCSTNKEPDRLEATIELIEMLGADTYLYASYGNTRMTVRTDPRIQVGRGGKIYIRLDKDRIHLFDSETEQSILTTDNVN